MKLVLIGVIIRSFSWQMRCRSDKPFNLRQQDLKSSNNQLNNNKDLSYT